MTGGAITEYSPSAIREVDQAMPVAPPPIHHRWQSIAGMASIRELALTPDGETVWAATWGGVLSWTMRETSYRRFTSGHGLAGGAPSSIAVDGDGRPWVGHTRGGVSWFDGARWRRTAWLRPEPVRLLAPACAAPGRSASRGVWVATAEAIHRLDEGDRPAEEIVRGTASCLGALALLPADDDDLLVGNATGLFRISPQGEETRLAVDELTVCRALARAADGAVWAAGDQAVYLLRADSVAGAVEPDPCATGAEIIALAAASERLWVLTSHGLGFVEGDTWTTVQLGPAAVLNPCAIAARGDRHSVILGTDESLARVWSRTGADAIVRTGVLAPAPEDVLPSAGRCVALDPVGRRVAVGTVAGLAVVDRDGYTIDSLAGDVRALASDPHGSGEIAVLSRPLGVGWLRSGGRVEFVDPSAPGIAFTLAWSDDGLFVLTSRGLYRLADGAAEPTGPAPPGGGRCLAQDGDGTWWLGADDGLYRLLGGWQREPELGDAAVNGILTRDGELWAATDAGLWRLHGGVWQAPAGDHDEQRGRVTALATASAGGVWFAGDTIYRYAPGSAESEPALEYPGDLPVMALVEDAEALWAIARAGMWRLALGGA